MKGIKYLLDTDTFSFLVSGRYPEVRKHATLHKDALSISSVTVAEALYGARRKSSEMDMMIAASAISGGYTLVTNNTRHFARIDGLTLDNWVDRRNKTS